jgi:hypothetical protein
MEGESKLSQKYFKYVGRLTRSADELYESLHSEDGSVVTDPGLVKDLVANHYLKMEDILEDIVNTVKSFNG